MCETKNEEKYFEYSIDQKLEAEHEKKICDIQKMSVRDTTELLGKLKTIISETMDRSTFDKTIETLPYLVALDNAIELLSIPELIYNNIDNHKILFSCKYAEELQKALKEFEKSVR